MSPTYDHDSPKTVSCAPLLPTEASRQSTASIWILTLTFVFVNAASISFKAMAMQDMIEICDCLSRSAGSKMLLYAWQSCNTRPCGDRTATMDQFVHYLGHPHMRCLRSPLTCIRCWTLRSLRRHPKHERKAMDHSILSNFDRVATARLQSNTPRSAELGFVSTDRFQVEADDSMYGRIIHRSSIEVCEREV